MNLDPFMLGKSTTLLSEFFLLFVFRATQKHDSIFRMYHAALHREYLTAFLVLMISRTPVFEDNKDFKTFISLEHFFKEYFLCEIVTALEEILLCFA